MKNANSCVGDGYQELIGGGHADAAARQLVGVKLGAATKDGLPADRVRGGTKIHEICSGKDPARPQMFPDGWVRGGNVGGAAIRPGDACVENGGRLCIGREGDARVVDHEGGDGFAVAIDVRQRRVLVGERTACVMHGRARKIAGKNIGRIVPQQTGCRTEVHENDVELTKEHSRFLDDECDCGRSLKEPMDVADNGDEEHVPVILPDLAAKAT